MKFNIYQHPAILPRSKVGRFEGTGTNQNAKTHPEPEKQRYKGKVKFYNRFKGFGFIETPEGDIYLSAGELNCSGYESATKGMSVSFEKRDGGRNPFAVKIKIE